MKTIPTESVLNQRQENMKCCHQPVSVAMSTTAGGLKVSA